MAVNTNVPDYISTDPWNDPYNPWPNWSDITIGAADISSQTFTLSVFNPNTPNVQYYTAPGGTNRLVFNGSTWRIYNNNNTSLYVLSTTARTLPTITPKLSGTIGFSKDNGTDASSVSATPGTDITPYAFRRLWNLNG
jgi:hypothetical protein